MLSFKQHLQEAGGQVGGSIELAKTDVVQARKYAEAEFASRGRDFDEELPDFDVNYSRLQKRNTKHGKSQRKDMPVIDATQVKDMQKRLQKGHIDINKPHAQTTKKSDLFPQRLKGADAEMFLKRGKEKYDGDAKDDIVKAKMESESAKNLKPIQKQIYVDKALLKLAEKGVKQYMTKLKKTILIVNQDNYIIDGHHRYTRAMVIDPNMSLKVLKAYLSLDNLLDLSLAYADALGNERNQ